MKDKQPGREPGDGRAVFEVVSDTMTEQPDIEVGTMMGFPCLRIDGAFFGSWDPNHNQLVVKLDAARVTDMVERGEGKPFAPNGRVFRQWVAVTRPDERHWHALLEEAAAFVAGSA